MSDERNMMDRVHNLFETLVSFAQKSDREMSNELSFEEKVKKLVVEDQEQWIKFQHEVRQRGRITHLGLEEFVQDFVNKREAEIEKEKEQKLKLKKEQEKDMENKIILNDRDQSKAQMWYTNLGSQLEEEKVVEPQPQRFVRFSKKVTNRKSATAA